MKSFTNYQKGVITQRKCKMLLEQEIYNIEKFENKIQKYALCCDDFNDGVYRSPKDKALLKNTLLLIISHL